jgi:hypothetical protein
MFAACLNEYHLQFLDLIVQRGVRFLIIGGQARAVHEGSTTRDLDLWVDISARNRPALDLALITWATEHPLHSSGNFSFPLPLRPGVQIKFPEDDVLYLDASNEPAAIGPLDCVDILTSIGAACFCEFYDRAEWRGTVGITLPFLARSDLETISPKKNI